MTFASRGRESSSIRAQCDSRLFEVRNFSSKEQTASNHSKFKQWPEVRRMKKGDFVIGRNA